MQMPNYAWVEEDISKGARWGTLKMEMINIFC